MLGPGHPDTLAAKVSYVMTLMKLKKIEEVKRIEIEMI